MRSADLLEEFVKDAIAAGQAPEAISAALSDAGWTDAEVQSALGYWRHAGGTMPPVPQPRPYVSARDVVFFGLLFVSLAALCWHIVVLGFSIIEAVIRDPGDTDAASFGMRWSIAALIVFLPCSCCWIGASCTARARTAGTTGHRCAAGFLR